MDSIFNIFKQLAGQFRTSNENQQQEVQQEVHQEVHQEVQQCTLVVPDTSSQSKRKIDDIAPQPSIKNTEDLRVFKSLSERPTKNQNTIHLMYVKEVQDLRFQENQMIGQKVKIINQVFTTIIGLQGIIIIIGAIDLLLEIDSIRETDLLF
ncbi:hypothetical protein CE11_00036 [Megavirus courdo11]|uniref:Uncharacterized protein n=1 Tax=Megavirus courdo11 TaxID=1128140 RepID=K7YFX8_9VIRU|nr:hypothetical protein CE11_00036 [Megavirus courdo11]